MTMTPARAPTPATDILALKAVRLEATLTGLLLEGILQQRFKNESGRPIEIIYTFPLVAGAALLGVETRVGEKHRTMTVAPAALVETAYEDAIEDGDLAIRVERSAAGLYTASLGNLKPGEDAELVIRFGQILQLDAGCIRISFPTTIAPRYGDATAAGLSPEAAPETDLFAQYPFEASIAVHGALARASLSSPSHVIEISQCKDGVRVSSAAPGGLDRDFVLTLGNVALEQTAALVEMDEGVALIAAMAPPPPQPREDAMIIHMVLDCSGSMAGESMAAARRALLSVAAMLHERDAFTLTAFGSDARVLIEKPLRFDDAGKAALRALLNTLDANMGGTEIDAALRTVLPLARASGGDMLVITDGQTWYAEGLCMSLARSGVRVFAIGVGAAPAEGSLRALCARTGGAAAYAATHEDVATAATAQAARMRLCAWRSLELPSESPPLFVAPLAAPAFAGDSATLVAVFETAPAHPLEAMLCAGDGVTARAVVASPPRAAPSQALAQLVAAEWARALPANESEDLCLRYGLISERTSGFLVEPRSAEDKEFRPMETIKVRQQLPAGWGGVGGAPYAFMPRAGRRLSLTGAVDAGEDPVRIKRLRKARKRERSRGAETGERARLRARYAALVAAIKSNFHAFEADETPVAWLDLLARFGLPEAVHDSILSAVNQRGAEGAEACALIALALKHHLGVDLPADRARGVVAWNAIGAEAREAVARSWGILREPSEQRSG